jgi:hypothetical protein
VTAQQVEVVVVGSANIGFGVALLAIAPDELPPPLDWVAKRLGRYRKAVAVLAIAAGLGFVAATVAGLDV